MILKSSRVASIDHARKMARHLLKANDNEVLQVWEQSKNGLENDMVDFQLLTELTRGKRGIFHVAINPRSYDGMTPEQWERSVQAIEKEFGLTGQPRVQVYHEKAGRPHLHVCWSLVDQEKGKLLDPSHDRPRLQTIAMELEKEFAQELTRRTANDNTIEITDKDRARQARTGKSPQERKVLITELWHQAKTPEAFSQAMQAHGYVIAKGNKARIIAVDREGEPFNLTRQLPKLVKAKEVRERLAGLDLPTLEQAQEMQREYVREAPQKTIEGKEKVFERDEQQKQEEAGQGPLKRDWEQMLEDQRADLVHQVDDEGLTIDIGKKPLTPVSGRDGETVSQRRQRRKRSIRSLFGVMAQYMNLSEEERAELRKDLQQKIQTDMERELPRVIKSDDGHHTLDDNRTYATPNSGWFEPCNEKVGYNYIGCAYTFKLFPDDKEDDRYCIALQNPKTGKLEMKGLKENGTYDIHSEKEVRQIGFEYAQTFDKEVRRAKLKRRNRPKDKGRDDGRER